MRKYYGITIGPITETLELSSKPLGLWLASYMFSELSYKICEKLDGKGIKILSPHFLKKDNNSQSAIGKYHDRVIFEVEENIDLDLDRLIEEAKDEILKKLNVDVDASYFYCKYDNVDEDTLAFENVIKYLGAKLDALELAREYFDVNNMFIFRELFGNNDNVKITSFFGDCYDSLNRDICLINSNADVRDLNSICNNKYYAILQADGDGVGQLLSDLPNEEISEFSKCLFEYSNELSDVIKEYGGSLIYAGGDDALAIVPLWKKRCGDDERPLHILELCQKINKLFVHHMTMFLDKFNDNAQNPNGLKSNLSVSFGVSIYYHKFPLYEAFKKSVKQLFERAKNHKNCIAIYAQKHSGQYFETIIENPQEGTLSEEYFNAIKASIIHSSVKSNTSFIYHLMQERALFEFAISKSLELDIANPIENLFKNYFDNVDQISNQDLQYNLEFVKQLIMMKKSKKLGADQIFRDIIQMIRIRKFLQEMNLDDE
ncbi:hypothetical protein NHG34_08020 [Aerococcaceae bacterium NML190938]|nr:hypothetical protein [Aerococcaceae bacterium NML191219]MCW6667503.1 hypothetical protein [Aerococcaceae bacterium NML190938]